MSQTILNEEASEALHHLNADVGAALRYLDGDAIPREHALRWQADLKTILDGRVVHIRTRGPGKKKAAAADAGA